MLDLFVESRLGQSVEGLTGTFSPTNLAMFFPVHDQQITAITGLKFTQAITERSGIFFGKLNALNGDLDRFLKYPLTSRFWNAAFRRFSIWALDRYPYSTPAGFYAWTLNGGQRLRVPGPELVRRAPDQRPPEPGSERRIPLRPGGAADRVFRPAGQRSRFSADSTEPGRSPTCLRRTFVELPAVAAGAQKGRHLTLLWNIEQRLLIDPDDPDRGLGLYIQTGLGDGNPNPVRAGSSGAAALCGNSHCRAATEIFAESGLLSPGPARRPEVRYRGCGTRMAWSSSTTWRITPGCYLTPDIEILHPGLAPVATAPGVRPPAEARLRLRDDFVPMSLVANPARSSAPSRWRKNGFGLFRHVLVFFRTTDQSGGLLSGMERR